MIVLVVACALVDEEGRVLLAQRASEKEYGEMWEFPGGKVEPLETPEEALIRELREELSIDLSSACLSPLSFASHPYPTFHLLMPLYVARRWKGDLIAREHRALAWVFPKKLRDYPLLPADLPLVAPLIDLL